MKRFVLTYLFLLLPMIWVAAQSISIEEALADTVETGPGVVQVVEKEVIVHDTIVLRDTIVEQSVQLVHDTLVQQVLKVVHDTLVPQLSGIDSLQIMRRMLREEWDNLSSYGLQPMDGIKPKEIETPLSPAVVQQLQIKAQKKQESPWSRSLSTLVQVSQNYISDNWYSGGQSNIALVGKFIGKYCYDNKAGFQWDNMMEWRWGFNSVQGDTLRKIQTNDDMLRLVSKVNYKAFSKWYYTGNLEFQTYIFRTYKGRNTMEMKTKFFSPMRVNFGVGLDYKPNKNFSVSILPLTYKMIHVYDTAHVDASSFGIPDGHRTLSELGSSIRANGTFQVAKNISITGRFYFYTSYHDIETELELESDFRINRFLSAHVMVYPRYNTQESSKLQFKELISIGFSHVFK